MIANTLGLLQADVLGAFQWDPGFRGVLTVVVSVVILCGSVTLILSTNSGARLGFLLSVAGLAGWLFVMGTVWSAYGIGPKGPAPTWETVDIVQGEPSGSSIETAQQLPLPGDGVLPDPVAVRDGDPALLEEFPADGRDPKLGDLVDLEPGLRAEIDGALGDWTILETSNKFTGEVASAADAELGPEGIALFGGPTEYAVIDSFVAGGEKPRADDSILGRVIFRVTNTLDFNHPPFLAAVQVQAVIPQETKPGQAPPAPIIDEEAPIYTVIMERDRGALRLPAISFTIFSGIVFAITCNMLHRRDKLAAAQRAAAVAGAA